MLFYCVTVWLGVFARQQASPPRALSAELQAHLKAERFQIVTSVRGLPLGVRESLQAQFEGPLDIAEPGGAFQGAGAAVDSKLPARRLVAAGCSMDHCLIYYERGGKTLTWRVMLFRWTPAETRFEWGAAAPGGLATIDDVRSGVLSGKIQGQPPRW